MTQSSDSSSPNMLTTSQKFSLIFSPSVILYALYLAYEYFVVENVDVRGWWPVALIFLIFEYGIIAMVYLLIDKRSPSSLRYTLIFSMLLTVSFLLTFSIEWLYPVNWLMVNDGRAELTLIQKLANYDYFNYIYIAALLIIHGYISFYRPHQKQ